MIFVLLLSCIHGQYLAAGLGSARSGLRAWAQWTGTAVWASPASPRQPCPWLEWPQAALPMPESQQTIQSAPNCIKHFHWLMELIWPIRFDFIIVSTGNTIGNNCNVKPDWPESPLGTVVKSNLIGQKHLVNQGNPLYNWVLEFVHYRACTDNDV